ncbi:MAG: hypothetical protein LBD29_11020 [Treponema sp.]|jgi:hypothetical protein|nr:hypothetical protein [Treponema sp.]
MKKKIYFVFFAAVWAFVVSIGSCGIEDYLFLFSIPSGSISVTLNQEAVIRLPDVSLTDYYYFTHFTIYYRIYVSEKFYPMINTGNMNELNAALSSDYNAFLPYTNTDTNNAAASIGTLFNNRHYYSLMLEGADIDDVLGSSALGKTLTLDFIESSPRSAPNLTIDNRKYTLQRSTGNGLFRPMPMNRYFFNTSELNDPLNITTGINADVVNKADITGTRYTYTAMYIVVTGMDSNFSSIYSVPSFIGVFYLPAP